MSTPKKLLVVIGATGLQGGAVARAFASHPSYRVRAVTRDPSAPKALALSSLGIEVVSGNLFDETSLHSAFAGAFAIYLVTDAFSGLAVGNFATDQEFQQAKNAIDVAAGVPELEHFVFSAGPSLEEATAGKYKGVWQYENKAAATRYLKEEKPELAKKTTILWVGAYFQNWTHLPGMFGPAKGEDGVWNMGIPMSRDTTLTLVDVEDVGVVVKAALRQGSAVMGKTVFAFGEDGVSQGEMLEDFGKLVNAPVRFEKISHDIFYDRLKASGMPDIFATAVRDTFQALEEFGGKLYESPGLVEAKTILGPGEKLKNWNEYAASSDWSWAKQ